jgi:peptide/nickel transport system substrate-binding protein
MVKRSTRATRVWRPVALLATVGLLASVLVAGGATASVPEAQKPKNGGTIVFGATAEMVSLDPAKFSQGVAGADRGIQIYDTLAQVDASGVFKPRIAESLTTTDGVTWVMKLRPNVKFSDGTAFDSAAVIFSIGRHTAPSSTSVAKGDVTAIANMVATDPLTVTFTMKAASYALPAILAGNAGMIVSPTAVQADPSGYGTKTAVGAGPFIVANWVRDSQLDLKKNPSYWQKGLPHLDGITARPIVDGNARAQCMLSGECDMVSLSPDISAQLKAAGGFVNPGVIATGGSAVVPNQAKAPGNDARVREAIALAFDPTVTNSALVNGVWTPSEWVCPPFTADRVECTKGTWPKYNLAKAKKLIKEYLAEPGHSADVGLLTYKDAVAFAEYVQQTLGSIGLNVTLDIKPATADYVTSLNAHDYQLSFSGLTPFDYPMPKLYQYFGQDARNIGQSNNPKLQAALVAARDSLDAKDRVAAFKEVTKQLNSTFTYIWVSPSIYGFSTTKAVHMPDYEAGATQFYADTIWTSQT